VDNAESYMKNLLKHILIILFLSFGLTSCFGLFDGGSDKITDKYRVLWIDLKQNQGISEEIDNSSGSYIEIIPCYVFAVGHNKNFIVAKQHPASGFESGYQINTKITNYYLVNLNIKVDKVTGPLTLTEFEDFREKLGITDIKFQMKYHEQSNCNTTFFDFRFL